MKNGGLNADLSTKMGTKTADNPDNCVSNPLYTLNCGKMRGGGSDEKYPKIRNKTAETPKNLPKR